MDYEKDFSDEFFDTEYGKIHAKHHHSSGKSLVFLHGLGANAKAWVKLVGVMPHELDIYLMDLLGHGMSDTPKIAYTISVQAEVLNETIKNMNIGNPYLIGHSYGGWIAAYYCAHYDSLSGLVLEDSVGLKEFFNEILNEGRKEEYKRDLLKKLLAVNDNKEYVMSSILDNEYNDDQLDDKMLRRISTRTLLVWGANDDSVDPSYAEIFHRKIKGSRVEIVSGAHHNPHYSQYEKFGSILLNFINQ